MDLRENRQETHANSRKKRWIYRSLLFEAFAFEIGIAVIATAISFILEQGWLSIFLALQTFLFVTAYRLMALYRVDSEDQGSGDA